MLELDGFMRVNFAIEDWTMGCCGWGYTIGCDIGDGMIGWLVYVYDSGDYGGTMLFYGEGEGIPFQMGI